MTDVATKSSLSPARRRLLELMQGMNFGWIGEEVLGIGRDWFAQLGKWRATIREPVAGLVVVLLRDPHHPGRRASDG